MNDNEVEVGLAGQCYTCTREVPGSNSGMGTHGLDCSGSGQRQVASCCECGNELQGSIKYREFLDRLRTCQLLKNDSAPWTHLVSQIVTQLLNSTNIQLCRSQWPRGLRRRSTAARLLRSWVRVPPGAWMFFCCECCVLSVRGLCDELITRPEESYNCGVSLCVIQKPQKSS